MNAIQEQNVQVAAGIIGAPPVPKGATAFQYTVNAQGRLTDEKEFGDIVVKTGANGQVTRCATWRGLNWPRATTGSTASSAENRRPRLRIFQLPGSNSIATSDAVRKKMDELKQRFPPGLITRLSTTRRSLCANPSARCIIRSSKPSRLVVLVVLIFLQTWRASIIPLIAMPVSLIGTFAAMAALGFSMNNLSLFGLVLAIGIVVDDAIVVVENVERHIEHGLSPRDAARKAMDEVSGAVVAVALVLCAVFIPTAFISGHHRAILPAVRADHCRFDADLGLQFAHAVTRRSPRCCFGRTTREGLVQRLIDGLLGWLFRGFNKLFAWSANAYGNAVARLAATGACRCSSTPDFLA